MINETFSVQNSKNLVNFTSENEFFLNKLVGDKNIWNEIAKYILTADLKNFSLTCHYFRDIGKSEILSSRMLVFSPLENKTESLNELVQFIGSRPAHLKLTTTDNNTLEHLKFCNFTTLCLCKCNNVIDKSLLSIANSKSLTMLDLSEHSQIIDKTLESIATFQNLTTLHLYWCDKITDNGLESIATIPNLTTLHLGCCLNLTDKGLESISTIPNLTTLKLGLCPKITDKGLEPISTIPNLTSLNLSSCFEITDKGLESISTIPNLTSLNLSSCPKITDKGMNSFMQRLPHVKILR